MTWRQEEWNVAGALVLVMVRERGGAVDLEASVVLAKTDEIADPEGRVWIVKRSKTQDTPPYTWANLVPKPDPVPAAVDPAAEALAAEREAAEAAEIARAEAQLAAEQGEPEPKGKHARK
jgi:hypothetical protein